MKKAKYSFFHFPLVHRTVVKCPLASSASTDAAFVVVSAMRCPGVTPRSSSAENRGADPESCSQSLRGESRAQSELQG